MTVQRVATLRKRITSGPRVYIFCLCRITRKLTVSENFKISMDVSNARVQSL